MLQKELSHNYQNQTRCDLTQHVLFISTIRICSLQKSLETLLAIIAKYGCPVRQWPLLYQIIQVLINKIALQISVRAWLDSRKSDHY